MKASFEKGDSNRCRNAYEKILHQELDRSLLEPHKKNKHISVGRCRMLAVNHKVALPSFEDLSAAGFELDAVPRDKWAVPTDCLRFVKKIAEEGLCLGHCVRCENIASRDRTPGAGGRGADGGASRQSRRGQEPVAPAAAPAVPQTTAAPTSSAPASAPPVSAAPMSAAATWAPPTAAPVSAAPASVRPLAMSIRQPNSGMSGLMLQQGVLGVGSPFQQGVLDTSGFNGSPFGLCARAGPPSAPNGRPLSTAAGTMASPLSLNGSLNGSCGASAGGSPLMLAPALAPGRGGNLLYAPSLGGSLGGSLPSSACASTGGSPLMLAPVPSAISTSPPPPVSGSKGFKLEPISLAELAECVDDAYYGALLESAVLEHEMLAKGMAAGGGGVGGQAGGVSFTAELAALADAASVDNSNVAAAGTNGTGTGIGNGAGNDVGNGHSSGANNNSTGGGFAPVYGGFSVHPWASLELEQAVGAAGGLSTQGALAASAARQQPAQVSTAPPDAARRLTGADIVLDDDLIHELESLSESMAGDLDLSDALSETLADRSHCAPQDVPSVPGSVPSSAADSSHAPRRKARPHPHYMSGRYGPYGGNLGGNAGGDFGVNDYVGDNVGANEDSIDFHIGSPLHPSAGSTAGSESVDTAPLSPYAPACAAAAAPDADTAWIDSMEAEYGCAGAECGMPPPQPPPDATMGEAGADTAPAGDDDAALLDAESEVQEAALRRVHSELVRLCGDLSNPPLTEHGCKRGRNGEANQHDGHSSDGCGSGEGHPCGYMSSGDEEDASLSSNSTGSEAETFRAKKRCRELLPAIAEELERLQHAFRAFSLPPAAHEQALAGIGTRAAAGAGPPLGGGVGGPPRLPSASKKLHTLSAEGDPPGNPSTATTPNNPNLHADGSWAGTTSGADFGTGTRDAQGSARSPEPEADPGYVSDTARALPNREDEAGGLLPYDEDDEPPAPLGALDKARMVKLLHERCARMRALADAPVRRRRTPYRRMEDAAETPAPAAQPAAAADTDAPGAPAAAADRRPAGSRSAAPPAPGAAALGLSLPGNAHPPVVRAESLPASASTAAVDAAASAAAAKEAAGGGGTASGRSNVPLDADAIIAAATADAAPHWPRQAAPAAPGAAVPARPFVHGSLGGLIAAVSAAFWLGKPVQATGHTRATKETHESTETATPDGVTSPTGIPTAPTTASAASPSSVPSAAAAAPPPTFGGTAPGTGAPAATSAAHATSSRLPRQSPINRATLPDGRRALFMFCSPLVAPLDCNPEAKALIAAGLLRASPPPLAGGSFSDLRQALREWRPHIFWFAGHGDSRMADGAGTLGFSGADGSLQLVSPAAIAAELRQHVPLHGGSLECVVLNACSSGFELGSLGEMLYQLCIPCVVGWRTRAHNVASAVFSLGFGAALAAGKPYPAAFDAGVGAVTAQLEKARGQPGVMLQRYELIDPASERVVQPSDVAAGRYPRADLYRVSRGPGKGRLAAGVPDIKAHPPEMGLSRPALAGRGGGPGSGDSTGCGGRGSGSGPLRGYTEPSSSDAGAAPSSRRMRPPSARRLAELGVLLASVAAVGIHTLAAAAPPPPPQPLLRADPLTGKLRLEPAALVALRHADSPICAVAIAGPQGEGKSTLANALLVELRAGGAAGVGGAPPPPMGQAGDGGAAPGKAPDRMSTQSMSAPFFPTSHAGPNAAAAPVVTMWLSRSAAAPTVGLAGLPRTFFRTWCLASSVLPPTLMRWACGPSALSLDPEDGATAPGDRTDDAAGGPAGHASGGEATGCGSYLLLEAAGLGVAPAREAHLTGGPRDPHWLDRPTDSTLSALPNRPVTLPLSALDAAAFQAARAAEAAAVRAFAFVQLACSRLVLNQRRQPNEALARRAAAAGRVAHALRPKMAAPPRALSPPAAPAAGVEAGTPELVLLLRDSQLRIGPTDAGAKEEEARLAVLEAWLESAGERDAAALRKAFRSFELKQIGTPSEMELDLLSSSGMAPTTAFGAELRALAAALAADVPPLVPPTAAVPTGAAVAAWLEATVRALNDYPVP